jgi:hypothetical protein
MDITNKETSILKLDSSDVRAIERMGSALKRPMDVMVLNKVNPMGEFDFESTDIGQEKPMTPTSTHPAVTNALFLATQQNNPYKTKAKKKQERTNRKIRVGAVGRITMLKSQTGQIMDSCETALNSNGQVMLGELAQTDLSPIVEVKSLG